MSTQTVFRLSNRTSIEDIKVHEEKVQQPASQEVLVRVRSVALNFRDYAIVTSKYPFAVKDNVVPCSDLSGEVEAVGSQVEGLGRGDKVIASFDLTTQYGTIDNWDHGLGGPVDGVLRQFVLLPSSAVVRVPRETSLSHAQLSSLVCTGTTAWNALYGNNPLKPGQVVLFLGTGGVSITGLMLAKAAGAVTIITSSSDEKLRHVQKTYGADHVINYRTNPEWSREVLRLTGGRGADIILENGGAGTIAQSIEAVAFGGIVAVIGFLAACPQEKMPDVATLALSKAVNVRGIIIGSKQQLEDVTRFVTAKGLELPVEKEFGFSREEVVAAYKYLASGQHVGKVCIKVD